MTNREFDALIAEKVMGWNPYGSTSVLTWKTPNGIVTWEDTSYPSFRPSTQIADAKTVSDKAGYVVVFAPGASVRDGCYANRKKEWLVEIIPHGGITNDAVWAYGKTEELARCLAALKAVDK